MDQEIVYSGNDAIQLHAVYGVNCYQNAIGYKPITIHFNNKSGYLSYLTLCPGDLAKIINDHDHRYPGQQISSYDMKKLIIAQCREDGLEELEARSVSEAIYVPDGKRLVAMLYSAEHKDFDFQFYDEKSNTWKNKTPLEGYSEREDLPKFLGGGYVLTRLFMCPEGIEPKGAPKGRTYSYKDKEITLNLPETVQSWERGPCLKREETGFYCSRTGMTYASPDFSFIKN